ncbi:type I-E CRISPR-associated protein Cas6/Cse3/CasE [Kitasatospora sp. NPDC059146]|uniref:type I-E CRISPR-associated protein Cas6/Cse3/CasE n=1 Tax=unclassified Kitasatospora TaxID=2633591 RepID=UPI0036B40C54
MTSAYLTEIRLNTRSRDVQADLRNGGYGFHHRTARLTDSDTTSGNSRLLWRLDTFNNGLRLLVQTTDKPDPTTLPDHYGNTRTLPLDKHLDRLTTGQKIRYRLAGNSVRFAFDEITGLPLPNRIPCKGDEITTWWTRRAPDIGLDIDTTATFQLPTVTGTRERKPGFRLVLTRYDGTATITNPDTLRTAMLTGIGRGKAFGAGLLTIAATL